MLQPEKIKKVTEEIGKARVDVVAVQEILWQGQGRIYKKVSVFSTVNLKRERAVMGQYVI